ncbi:MAG: haloacid dehalogenase type II [Flavobacterium sp.]|uniref:haloacid dehalogenase type II n=1 Tax=Flavobacterium sp. TaxID=239 RepID=UPI00121CFF5E|nr:haloacid dehalogenase type II [Flavobacterium sp.]RZJ68439.1 MAG: haloacid dehalogenase type II [Flavobacterium sp.]
MIDRRGFITQAITIGATGLVFPSEILSDDKALTSAPTSSSTRPKALFFDVNETLLDLGPVKKSIAAVLGDKADLATLWFTTMLHYSLVVTVSGKYHDFGAIGVAALQMVAQNNSIKISKDDAIAAVRPILNLQPHPDVVAGLTKLKENGYTLVSFTNSSKKAVQTQLQYAGLTEFFHMQLSIEELEKFKPHKDAYAWAAKQLDIENRECLLVAAHGWDVAGAAWAGWRTAFISRAGQQLFPLAPEPEFNEPDLQKIAASLCVLK